MTKMEIIIASLSTLSAALVTIGALAYKVHRLLKRDANDDVLSEKALGIIKAYEAQTTLAEDKASRLQDRLEITEKERNALATEVGELRASVVHLSEKVDIMNVTIEEYKLQIEQLMGMSRELLQELKQYRENDHKYERELYRSGVLNVID